MPNPAGLYLHVPFCAGKCNYCDFYSVNASEKLLDGYFSALAEELEKWGGLYDRPFDTVYIGGGTPSLLGERIIPLMDTVRRSLDILPDAEITVEMNPTSASRPFLRAAKEAGVNRLSVGVQSGDDGELAVLGRKHTAGQAALTVETARAEGFRNISLDLMICLPNSSIKTLETSLDFTVSLSPEHISVYMLKIEPNTPFGRSKALPLPDDDGSADQYLFVCGYLEDRGYSHYEISNFARRGCESRHNLKYWRLGEYLGIGPSAHSFANGRRFYYPRDLQGFLSSPQTVPDGEGGGEEERIMLALRLAYGFDFKDFPQVLPLLKNLEKAGLGTLYGTRFSLTNSGMAVSNAVIIEILEQIK